MSVAGRTKAVLSLLVTIAMGCAVPFKMSDPAVTIEPAKVAAFPPGVRSGEVDGIEDVTPNPVWELAAARSLGASVNYRVSAQGGRYFEAKTLERMNGARAMADWVARAMGAIQREIGTRMTGNNSSDDAVYEWRHPTESHHDAVYEWRHPTEGLAELRTSLSADFVLVTHFLDDQVTTARKVSNVLAMGAGVGLVVHARRVGMGCVVDLRDGRVVRCAFVSLRDTNVRERAGAQVVVDQLIARLFATKLPPTGSAAPPVLVPPVPEAATVAPNAGSPAPANPASQALDPETP